MLKSLSENKYFLAELMSRGAVIDNNDTAFIDDTAVIGSNVRIANNVVIGRNCYVGENTVLGANSVIINAKVGKNCSINGSVIEDSYIGDYVSVEPYAFILRGSVVADGVNVKSFTRLEGNE